MSKAGIAVSTKVSLGNQPFFSPVEQSSPFLQFSNPLCGFLTKDFSHAPVV
jgi:hypothetical protein